MSFLYLHRFSRRSSSPRRQTDIKNENTKPPGKTWAIARECIETLRPLAGAVPGLGSHIQALLDTATAVINKVERIRAWKAGKSELSRKINHMLEMVTSALGHPYAANTPDLWKDLEHITKVLQTIEQFVELRTKGCKLSRFVTCSSDYETILELGAQIDEAIKMLIIKSAIQTRLDIQALNETVQRGNTSLHTSLQQSAEALENIVTSNKETLDEIRSGIIQLDAKITPASSVKYFDKDDLDKTSDEARGREKGREIRPRCDCSSGSESSYRSSFEEGKKSTRDEEPGGTIDRELLPIAFRISQSSEYSCTIICCFCPDWYTRSCTVMSTEPFFN